MDSSHETRDRLRGVLSITALILAAAIASALASCSTTEGFGKDVKNLGGGIEESAERNK